MGPLLFNIYISDFPLQIKSLAKVIMSAYNIQYPFLSH